MAEGSPTDDVSEGMVDMCSYSEAVYGAGFREGFRKGEIEVIADLVRDNIITLAVAAERAGVSEEGFRAEAELYGRQLPPLADA